MKFYPLEKGGKEKSFSHAQGGGGGGATKCFGVVLMRGLDILTILKGGGGTQSFYSSEGGSGNVLPCLEGGGLQKVSHP